MEKTLESWLGDQVRRSGGIWLKWVSPGCTGVPDRILIAPGGIVAFVEMKQPGGKVGKRQAYMINLLTHLGCKAYVIYDKEQARAMLREVLPDAVQTS